ncbi:hypothetical protein N9V68_01485 [Octadecabacter sp.]|nr:hypothetical protein [Octadecabacter sp.]
MNPDVFLPIAFGIMIGLLGLMVAVGIPRGKRMQRTNEQIEANQRRQMDMSERQTKAIERIADALEPRR